MKENKPLIFSYEALKEGLLELYLSVKIRSDDEIDGYNEELFKEEKRQLREIDGFALIDYIKSSIEVLMNMKVEEQDEMENPGLFDGSSNYLQGSINRHERSDKSPFRKGKRQGTQEIGIENKHIDIHVGSAQLVVHIPMDEVDGEVRVGMPEMDS